MKSIIKVFIDDKLEEPYYEATFNNVYGVDVALYIYTNSKNNFDELISNKNAIKEALDYDKEEYLEWLRIEGRENDLVFTDSIDEIMNGLEYIGFDAFEVMVDSFNHRVDIVGEYDEETTYNIINNYLSDHPEYKNYPIVIPENINGLNSLDELKEKYKDYKNVLVQPSGDLPIPIEEAESGVNLNNIIEDIKNVELSPLEKIIFIYDLVKEKPYKHEGEEDSSFDSRSVFRSITGDSIVCLGYANIMESILHRLGYRVLIDNLEGLSKGEPGHARLLVYLKDEKYNVDGVYVIDPTMDSRAPGDKYNYLYNYCGLLKPIGFFNENDEINETRDVTTGYFVNHDIDDFEDMYKIVKKTIFDVVDNENSFSEWKNAKHTIKSLAYLILNMIVEDDSYKEVTQAVKENEEMIKDKINKPIDAFTILQAVTEARVIENLMNPNKYELDYDKLIKNSLRNGFNIDIDRHLNYKSNIERLLASIFGIDDEEEEEETPIDASTLTEEELRKIVLNNFKSEYIEQVKDIKTKKDKNMYKVVKSISIYSRGKNDTKR